MLEKLERPLPTGWKSSDKHSSVAKENEARTRSEPSRHGAAPVPASFEAVLRQLEEQGFRHVPKLLREQSHWQP
jgi:hypothetical protein